MKAYIEERSQKSVGTWPNSGPDTYVAVQLVPNGVAPLRYLNSKVAELRGIKIIYCGEGYANRDKSPNSMLNLARSKAQEIANKYE